MQLPLALLVAAFQPFTLAAAHEVAHDGAMSQGSSSTPKPAPAAVERAARLLFSDRGLLTHRGEHVAFYSDVLADRVVLINFVFTHCTDSCPTQTAKMAEVQALIDRPGDSDVRLVSISVDPDRDTPPVLARYAASFHAGPHWTFLTGSRRNVDDVLRRLGQSSADPRSHTSLFIAGNAATGHWLRLHPDATPAVIATQLNMLAAERKPSNAHAAR